MPQTHIVKKTKRAKWTVMLFMAADNQIGDAVAFNQEALSDLMEIKEIGSTDEVHFLAQLDGIGKTTPVYHLQKGTALEEDIIYKVREVNMGSVKTLLGFLDTCVKGFPAEHYMFVLWGHGNGWATDNFWDPEGGIPPSSLLPHAIAWRIRGFSPGGVLPDGTVGRRKLDYLDSFELLKVFKLVKRKIKKNLDILGFDACLMGMIEGAYQFRETVDQIIFSEDLQYSTDGWAYKEIAAELVKQPHLKAEDLAVHVVQQFIRKYEFQFPATLSACNMTGMSKVAAAIDHLATALVSLMTPNQPTDNQLPTNPKTKAKKRERLQFSEEIYQAYKVRKAIWSARREVQQFDLPLDPNEYLPDNIDLYHFCRLLRKYCDRLEVRKACKQIMKILESDLFLCSGVSGEKVGKSYGLAIYFPTNEVNSYYTNLGFSQKTHWGKFLQTFLDKQAWGNFLAYDVYYGQTEN